MPNSTDIQSFKRFPKAKLVGDTAVADALDVATTPGTVLTLTSPGSTSFHALPPSGRSDNIDGGEADSIYGGDLVVDCGHA